MWQPTLRRREAIRGIGAQAVLTILEAKLKFVIPDPHQVNSAISAYQRKRKGIAGKRVKIWAKKHVLSVVNNLGF